MTLAAAFVLVKRGREALFAAIGYVLLLVGDAAQSRETVMAAESAS